MKTVLFLCNHNAGRSQDGRGVLQPLPAGGRPAESGGNDPATEIWPEVVSVMAERGFDLAGQEPKKVTVEMQLRADWAVAVGCEDTCPFVPTTLEEWEIPDPAGRTLPQLTREFDGANEPQEIRATADDILWRYGDVPVRSFVVARAHREARDRLRERTPAVPA